MFETKDYRKTDGTCSATCQKETDSCSLYGRAFMHGDACVFLNRSGICMSPEPHQEVNRG